MSLTLAVNNVPLLEGFGLFNDVDRAFLFFWLLGVEVDAGFEALAWSRVTCRNDNGRAW